MFIGDNHCGCTKAQDIMMHFIRLKNIIANKTYQFTQKCEKIDFCHTIIPNFIFLNINTNILKDTPTISGLPQSE